MPGYITAQGPGLRPAPSGSVPAVVLPAIDQVRLASVFFLLLAIRQHRAAGWPAAEVVAGGRLRGQAGDAWFGHGSS